MFFDRPTHSASTSCAPRNSWESFAEDIGYFTMKTFADATGLSIWLLAATAALLLIVRSLRREIHRLAAIAIISSGAAAGLGSLALMTYPKHEPFLLAIGTALAVGAAFAAAQATTRR